MKHLLIFYVPTNKGISKHYTMCHRSRVSTIKYALKHLIKTKALWFKVIKQ